MERFIQLGPKCETLRKKGTQNFIKKQKYGIEHPLPSSDLNFRSALDSGFLCTQGKFLNCCKRSSKELCIWIARSILFCNIASFSSTFKSFCCASPIRECWSLMIFFNWGAWCLSSRYTYYDRKCNGREPTVIIKKHSCIQIICIIPLEYMPHRI